ncbi:TonB-dependent receptor, partial [Salmonella enterica subsp. enterica serovar Enteritidis]|nr:TonB-dependent receptor [Salmonella enterica subsp. enterica serovar Enteritidis]
MNKSQIARLRTGAALSAFVLAGSLFAAPALAQDAPASAGTTAPPQDAPANDGDIVVTGTIFRQSDTHTALPVTVITAENLQRAGITNVTDAIRSASADGAGSIGNG